MSEAKNDIKPATLFFVKNLSHQFTPVEKFLKKRGYTVVIETDVKTALDRILKENPEYIFLAWDHKNENVRLMPKTIYQSCTGSVVPFIMSTQRDQIIQIESSGFENKLYPPLSGPAIIRVISKSEKKNQIFEQINTKKAANAKKESDMIQVKSFFTQDNNEGPEINFKKSNNFEDNERKKTANRSRGKLNMFVPKQRKRLSSPIPSAVQEGIRAKMKHAIEEQIGKLGVLSALQKEAAKAKLMRALQNDFGSEAASGKLLLAIKAEIATMGELSEIEQKQTSGSLIALMEAELAEALAAIEPNIGNGAPALSIGEGIDLSSSGNEPMSDLLPRESKSLNSGQIMFLDQSFTETVKPEMLDVIENYADQKTNQLDLNTTTQIYVLVVQELEWTGYLTVASENYLDVASAQVILNNWIKQMIRIEQIDQQDSDQNDSLDSTLFEIHVPKVDFANFCSYKSDFFKDVDYQGKKTMIGFFSFSPFEVINSIHPTLDMLELPTEFLQPDKELPFDVNLYLPENEKFILYIRPGSFLDSVQVSRLQTRKVKYIFASMDYELALLKYKTEFNINKLIDIYHRIKASKT